MKLLLYSKYIQKEKIVKSEKNNLYVKLFGHMLRVICAVREELKGNGQ